MITYTNIIIYKINALSFTCVPGSVLSSLEGICLEAKAVYISNIILSAAL